MWKRNTLPYLSLILLSCMALALGFSTQYIGNTKHPTLPEHCYYPELDLAVPRNETIFPVNQPNFCAQIYCREDYVLMIKHCDRVQLANGCHFTSYNYSLPYPDCCARRVCSNELY